MLGFTRILFAFFFVVIQTGAVLAAAPVVKQNPDDELELIFADITHSRLDQALSRVDRVIKDFPNFRLAYLIRGDLLLAHSGPIMKIGNGAGNTQNANNLRNEALKRLQGYKSRPDSDQIPRNLLALAPNQKNAILVDTNRARLYVYENLKGRPHLVTDLYVSQGKAGASKWREGDNRTPLGVYKITSFIPPSKLNSFYGSGAFPINYPNEWDKKLGRTGSGIWLHGSPKDTYSRPPLASEGCVVLSNDNLDYLAKYVDLGITPVIISNGIEWLNTEQWLAERRALGIAIEQWRRDVQNNNLASQLTHYTQNFSFANGDLDKWKTKLNDDLKNTPNKMLHVSNISMFRNPGKTDLISVYFTLQKQSGTQTSRSAIQQYWVRENGLWKIAFQSDAKA